MSAELKMGAWRAAIEHCQDQLVDLVRVPRDQLSTRVAIQTFGEPFRADMLLDGKRVFSLTGREEDGAFKVDVVPTNRSVKVDR